MTHRTPTAEELATRLDKPRQSGDGWIACCPAHDDRNPSLSIRDKPGGGLLLNCHAGCSYESVIRAAGIEMDRAPAKRTGRSVEAQRWTYLYGDGKPAFHVHRSDGRDGKRYWQSLPDGTRKAHKRPRPLYDLHHLVKHPERHVLVVEGEKAAVAARGISLFQTFDITTSAGGSTAANASDWTPMKGRDVTIWPDADEPGKNHAADVAKLCREAGAKSIRVVDVAGLPHKWDLAEPIPEGIDLSKLLDSARSHGTPQLEPPRIALNWMEDLMDVAAPIPWIWNGWLARSALTLLAGPKGLGKSTLALHIAAMVTRGECPGQNGEPGLVLYWSGEDDIRILASRALAARMGDDFATVGHFWDRPFDPATDMRRLIGRWTGAPRAAARMAAPT